MNSPLQDDPQPEKEKVPLEKKIPINTIFYAGLGILAVVIFFLLFLVIFSSPEGTQREQGPMGPANLQSSEATQILQSINNLTVQIRAIEQRVIQLEEAQTQIQNDIATTTLTANTASTTATNAKNQSEKTQRILASLYRLVQNLEVQLQQLGGGFDLPQDEKPTPRQVNPYIGAEELP